MSFPQKRESRETSVSPTSLIWETPHFSLHPLIREFFLMKLSALPEAEIEENKRCFCRVMAKLAQEIPNTITLKQVKYFKPLIPHLQLTAKELNQWLADTDLNWPSNRIGRFYEQQGLYKQAEPYYIDCLNLTQQRLGKNYPDVVTNLHDLAYLFRSQGRYVEAESLYLQALDLCKCLLGENQPDIAASLNNLALLYHSQGKYEQAVPLYQEALVLRKHLLGENHPHVADSLNNLAGRYYYQRKYKEAEPLFLKALDIYKRLLGDNEPDVAFFLDNLAGMYLSQGRYKEAESLYLEAIAICRRVLGENHLNTRTVLNNYTTMQAQRSPRRRRVGWLQRVLGLLSCRLIG